jgi:hypothetical protein
MTKDAKAKEVSAEEILRELVMGRRTEVPPEGVPGVEIVYMSGPVRVHRAWTSGRVEITPEREVLVDVELTEAAGVGIERVRFGHGPRRWRFPLPTDPPPRKKAQPARPTSRTLKPGENPRSFGNPFGMFQSRADT